ncbi:adenosine deaminase family protein [Granulicella tundricola]|uniref:adenosine deaminase n=1 Tax=Granulicella tundricola (strain ATCC BAA-1859 / DSM 23138 / MP5ACTX9) TaxID=1198114 RepID=E8WWQ0_GRATM|nr:adenosine deaminase [Granulicella tundricola]ADW67378.1 adenosine/AMP deaminase [Granulicella tundricola MP5ACTX9]
MRESLCILLASGLAVSAFAQPAHHIAPANQSERRATQAFESAKALSPLALHSFLERMPKGADLHMHLSGAIYAETFIKDAAEDNLCVDPIKLAFAKSIGTDTPNPTCAPDNVLAATAFKNQHLYDALVDSFSMRAYVPTPGHTGHDQFFDTFEKFGGIAKTHKGEWLDEVASRAAAQNEQYLEIMETPTFSKAAALGYKLGWPTAPTPRIVTTAATSVPDDTTGTLPAELADLRDKLLASGLKDEVVTDRAEFAKALADRRQIEHCGTPTAAPACAVQIRFLYQVLRAFPAQQVFAQTLLAFEVADAELASGPNANVVGLNFVQPEDNYMAMSEYHRQMLMLDYLHSVYPRVHISLHAGELAPGMVPPAGLSFHIRQAVELGHAERIGHGVDVMYETDSKGLLKELADKHIMVEINLTSNDGILGVSTNYHSLPAYRAAHVPTAFSTDDEGVSRIDLTHEYARAVKDFNLTYPDLKRSARTSLEHSFLPGPSLWAHPDDFTTLNFACIGQAIGSPTTTFVCGSFLKSSPRAAQQWELEHRFQLFESSL